MSSPRNFILTDFNLRRLQVLGAPSSLDGDPGRPGGLLRPAGGHRPGKQLRPGHWPRLGASPAAVHGGPWHHLRWLHILGITASPGGLLRPARGHRTGKQSRPGPQPENPHAASCGGLWQRLRRLQVLGATPTPRRRSWAPWRPATASARAPAWETAAPWAPA